MEKGVLFYMYKGILLCSALFLNMLHGQVHSTVPAHVCLDPLSYKARTCFVNELSVNLVFPLFTTTGMQDMDFSANPNNPIITCFSRPIPIRQPIRQPIFHLVVS